MAYWLIKSDPETYSWHDLNHDKLTVWDGVRNYAARNFLAQMKVGDLALFYHSQFEKSVVGISEIIEESFPDKSADVDSWLAVKIAPLKSLKKPVSLIQIKENPILQDIMLIKQQRLSVMPLTEDEYKEILRLSK